MQDDLDKAAGTRLRELRIAAGLSQEDLSFAAKLDQSMLSRVERLGPGEVGWARFCRIVEALGHEVEVTYRPAKKSSAEKITRAAKPASARRL
jgi:transcriptional regulator with XRE-family HTH domain